MIKILFLLLFIVSQIFAVNFATYKEDFIAYIDKLDHPNRDRKNLFSTNLALVGNAYNTHITIYSDGLAMIWEEKNVSIAIPGNIKVMYSDVASKMDFSSVSMHFDKNVTLLSQRYAYDTVNFSSLLNKYIGKYILYNEGEKDKKIKRQNCLPLILS